VPAEIYIRSIDDEVRRGSATLNRAMGWRVLVQGQMRSKFVVVVGVGGKDSTQVGVAKDDDMVEAFPAYRANQSLRMPVLAE
jgi:hypothetical protein